MRPIPSPLISRGFSLIELLVSMVIALLVLAGVINSYLASRTAFRFNEELAFIQENARYATEYLSREIRGAGYLGCDTRNSIIVNSVNNSLNGFIGMNGLQGFEGSNKATTPFPTDFSGEVLGRTDAVIVRQGDQDNSFPIASHDLTDADLFIVGTHNYSPGTIFVISDSDCRHQGIFAMSGPNSSDNIKVVHNTGGGTNCTKSIRGSGSGDNNGDGLFDCNDSCGTNSCSWSDNSTPYDSDATLMTMSAKAFYIGPSLADNAMPALFIRSLSNGGAVGDREELVTGIEDFQLTYGVDTNDDGQPDRYFTADNVGADDWGYVVAVRIQMVARSRNPVLEQAEERTFLDEDYNDRFLRQLITTTIRVRNYLG